MTSRLYGYLLMCWKSGTIDADNLTAAVTKNYITEQEKLDIMAVEQNQM